MNRLVESRRDEAFRWGRVWLKQLWPLIEALAIAVLLVTFGFTTVGISGSSMWPTLENGERVFVPRYETWLHRLGVGEFERGEVVYFTPPESVNGGEIRLPWLGLELRRSFIKRIVAVEGDRIELRRGELILNGRPVQETYLSTWRGNSSLDALVVPEGQVFVLGDNRGPGGSNDSRRFGPVDAGSISGRAAFVVWPLLKRDATAWRWNVGPVERPEVFRRLP